MSRINVANFRHPDGTDDNINLDSSGRVGIGTQSPGAKLTIAGSDEALRLNHDNAYINFRNTADDGQQGFIQLRSNDTSRFWVTASQDLQFATANRERVRIDASGRVLVGTPTARVIGNAGSFNSSLQVETTAYAGLSIVNNSNDGTGALVAIGKSRGTSVGSNTIVQSGDTLGEIRFAGADGTALTSSFASIVAQVDGTPGVNNYPGRLVFFTTADGSASPTERMRILKNGGLRIFSTGPSTRISSTEPAGTDEWFLIGSHSATGLNSGTNSIIVYTNGNVVNTNNSYGAISDLRLKENIVNANSQWDDLKALQIRNYNFKEGQTHTQIGLVAQEVELVSPGLVSESPDRDKDGNDLGTVTKSVNYSGLYMKAVKALQEAMERIEALEAKVAALESA